MAGCVKMEAVFINEEDETIKVKEECTEEDDPLSIGNEEMSFEMIKSEVKAKEEESCEYIDIKEEYIGASNPPNDVMDSGVTGLEEPAAPSSFFAERIHRKD